MQHIFAKTATYGVMHIFVAFCVGYFVTGDVHIAIGISLLEPIAQIVCFAAHEKIWERFRPGSAHHPPKMCCADAEVVAEIAEHLHSHGVKDAPSQEAV